MLYHLVVALCVAAAAAKPGGDKPGGDAKAKCGELAQAAFACLDAASAVTDCSTQMTEAKECFKECEKEGKGPRGPPPNMNCLLYTSPSPRDRQKSRMPSSA